MLPLDYIGLKTQDNDFESGELLESERDLEFESDSFILADACSWSGVSTELEEACEALLDWDDITEAIPTSDMSLFDDIDTMDVQKIDANPLKYPVKSFEESQVHAVPHPDPSSDPLADLIADIIFLGVRYATLNMKCIIMYR